MSELEGQFVSERVRNTEREREGAKGRDMRKQKSGTDSSALSSADGP